jgi:ABC-type multidrug transport system fused ATPase/permease subunit
MPPVDSAALLNALLLIVGFLTFFSTVLWTLRETYVHDFRMADMNLFEHTLESEITRDRERTYHRRAAKQWLHVSEDYRRTSLYLSMMVANMIMSTPALIFATIFMLLGNLVWLALLLGGIVFVFIGLLDMLMLYQWLNPIRAVEKFSWSLAERFPPMLPFLAPSHLARGGDWRAIQDLITERAWLREALEQLWLHKHLKRLFGYGKPSFFQSYCGTSNPYDFETMTKAQM